MRAVRGLIRMVVVAALRPAATVARVERVLRDVLVVVRHGVGQFRGVRVRAAAAAGEPITAPTKKPPQVVAVAAEEVTQATPATQVMRGMQVPTQLTTAFL